MTLFDEQPDLDSAQTAIANAVEDAANRLAARWLDLDAERKRIADEQDRLKIELRDLLGYGRHAAGAVEVTVAEPQRRWNVKRAEAVLPPDVVEACSVTTLDRARVQAAVAPELYAQCQIATSGEPTVTIR